MPKENSHFYLASKVAEKIKNPEIIKIIQDNFYFYQLGSFTPDVFSYGKTKDIVKISMDIHGFNNKKTNRIIFKMLNKTNDNKNLAFVFGFLTHLAADATFHPLVYHLTGPAGKSKKALYRHVAWETGLDKFLHNHFLVPRPDFKKIKQLIFSDILEKKYGISKKYLYKNYKRQFLYSRLFQIAPVYWILKLLYKCKVFKQKDKLGLFYANKLYSKNYFLKKFRYLDPLSGQPLKTTIKKLSKQAISRAASYIETVYDYYSGKINRQAAKKTIRGKNLSTGKVNAVADDMRFFKKI